MPGAGWPRPTALALLAPLAEAARDEAVARGVLTAGDDRTWVAALFQVSASTARAGGTEPGALGTAFADAVAEALRAGSALRQAGREAFERQRDAWLAFGRGDGPEPVPEPPGECTEGQRREWLTGYRQTGYRQAEAAARAAVAAIPTPGEAVRDALKAWQAGEADADPAMRITGAESVPGLYALVAACGGAVRIAPSAADGAAALAVLVAAGVPGRLAEPEGRGPPFPASGPVDEVVSPAMPVARRSRPRSGAVARVDQRAAGLLDRVGVHARPLDLVWPQDVEHLVASTSWQPHVEAPSEPCQTGQGMRSPMQASGRMAPTGRNPLVSAGEGVANADRVVVSDQAAGRERLAD